MAIFCVLYGHHHLSGRFWAILFHGLIVKTIYQIKFKNKPNQIVNLSSRSHNKLPLFKSGITPAKVMSGDICSLVSQIAGNAQFQISNFNKKYNCIFIKKIFKENYTYCESDELAISYFYGHGTISYGKIRYNTINTMLQNTPNITLYEALSPKSLYVMYLLLYSNTNNW